MLICFKTIYSIVPLLLPLLLLSLHCIVLLLLLPSLHIIACCTCLKKSWTETLKCINAGVLWAFMSLQQSWPNHNTALLLQPPPIPQSIFYSQSKISIKLSYLPERLKNDAFRRVSCSASWDDSVHLEPWLEMTAEMLAAVDIGQQEQLP